MSEWTEDRLGQAGHKSGWTNQAPSASWWDCGTGIRINPVLKWKPDGTADIECLVPVIKPRLAGRLTLNEDGSSKWEPVK